MTCEWIAELSNGQIAEEGKGEFAVVSGQRTPWVRLCSYCAENDLTVTSLKIKVNNNIISLPLNAEFYSLQYAIAGEIDETGAFSQQKFVDAASHFKDYSSHYYYNLTLNRGEWIRRTDSDPMAPTPRR